jgi:hypothetical protein
VAYKQAYKRLHDSFSFKGLLTMTAVQYNIFTLIVTRLPKYSNKVSMITFVLFYLVSF